MKNFLKDNVALVVGMALPLLLIALFYVAGQTASSSVPEPRYSAVFAQDYYPNNTNNGYRISIDGGKLVVRYAKPTGENYYLQKPRLFVFDHKTLASQAVPVDYDQIVEGIVRDPDIDALNAHKIVADTVSPDGYNFEHYYSDGGSGLFGEMFGWGGRYNSRYVLRNGAKVVPVRSTDPVYQAHFIGWIVE